MDITRLALLELSHTHTHTHTDNNTVVKQNNYNKIKTKINA